MLILDLATKRQHWIFESENFGNLLETESFEFNRAQNKVEFECIHSYDPFVFFPDQLMTVVSYEVCLPDFTTTIVSAVEMTLENY